MKATSFIAAAAIVAAGVFAIGFPAKKASAKPSHSEAEPWTFKPGRGVTLSEAAAKAIGLATAEVESADITPDQEALTVQVYRAASENPADDRKALGSFFLPAAEAQNWAVGQSVSLRGDAGKFESVVEALPAARGGIGGSAEVLVSISDPKSSLRAGSFLEARLGEAGGTRTGVVAIPRTSVVDSVRGPFVYVQNGASTLRTPVKLGPVQGALVEVLDGLFEGDVVVTSGASDLWLIELQAVNGGKGCGDAH